MDFGFTEQEKAFQREVRQFVAEELTEEAVAEEEQGLVLGRKSREFLRKLGARGWLAPTWPEEYGGIDASYVQRFIIAEEMAYGGGPRALVGAGMAGPTILMYGSEEQKKEYLPRIASGEIEFALGYTEPEAGSDLAALEIRAVEDGDDYVINGQKRFNTHSHAAEYHWLGARTDPNAPKHKGISLFIVDLKSPGITISPLWTIGERTNEVFYDDVRVPKQNLVGEKNRGWYHIATALDFERIWVVGGTQHLLEELVEYAQEARRNGESLARDPMTRHKLAELAIEVEIARLLSLRVAWMQSRGVVPNYESSMAKLFGSELEQRVVNVGMQLLGLYGQLNRDSKWARLGGRMEYKYRDCVRLSITRGTSEVQRGIIALRGLQLPR